MLLRLLVSQRIHSVAQTFVVLTIQIRLSSKLVPLASVE